MKKRTTTLVSTILALSLLNACSGGNGADSAKSGTTEAPAKSSAPTVPAAQDDLKEKLELSIMTMSFEGGGWPEQHEITDYLNKKFNVDLKIQWLPSNNYVEKLNVLAASNQFPDSYLLGKQEYLKYRDRGVFLDLKPLLAGYPNLQKHLGGEKAFQMMNPPGKYYGLPYFAIEIRDSLALRKDWLDKLGLKMPTTTDEFYNVAKAFAKQDPDGDGKDNTIGFTTALNPQKRQFLQIEPLMAAFGLYNNWGLQDGKLVNWHVQSKELKDFASFMRKAYAEGVLDKDFAVNKQTDPNFKFEGSKVGIAQQVPSQLHSESLPTLQKIAPKAEIAQIIPIKGPSGRQGTKTATSVQRLVINAKIDPQKQKRLLMIYDYMLSDEGNVLFKNGIEGVDYKKEGDKYVKLDAFDKNRPSLLAETLLRRFDNNIATRLWDDKKKVDEVNKWYENVTKFAQPNEAAPFESETDTKVGVTIDSKFMTALVKVIMGETPVESLDQAIEQWKKDGGDKITEEYNQAYQQLKQK